MYIMHTRDLPSASNGMTATFADDTVEKAAILLQHAINAVIKWTKEWRIKLNGDKSVHANFTNKRNTYHRIRLFDVCITYANTAKCGTLERAH